MLRVMRSRLYEGLLLLEADVRWVLICRYGLAHMPTLTLRELADNMGTSPATVLRLERRGLAELRAWL